MLGEVYNIASEVELSNLELAQRLCALFGRDSESAIDMVPDRAFNDCRYHIDGKKMKRLGWVPKIPFEEGLKKTSTFFLCRPQIIIQLSGTQNMI